MGRRSRFDGKDGGIRTDRGERAPTMATGGVESWMGEFRVTV
jgi:hypothetical protein